MDLNVLYPEIYERQNIPEHFQRWDRFRWSVDIGRNIPLDQCIDIHPLPNLDDIHTYLKRPKFHEEIRQRTNKFGLAVERPEAVGGAHVMVDPVDPLLRLEICKFVHRLGQEVGQVLTEKQNKNQKWWTGPSTERSRTKWRWVIIYIDMS